MAARLGNLKVVSQTSKVNTGTVFFLHGSGDTGPNIHEWVEYLVGHFALPHIKFLFPTAPFQSYTPLQGERSRVWFDRYDITPDVPDHKESIQSIGETIKDLIKQEVAAGIPPHKIIVGGFSMGGALALHTAYRFLSGLGGAFTLSSFLSRESAVYEALRQSTIPITTPLFMCHGDRDTMVPLAWGRETFDRLTELNVKGEFITIPNALHELKKREIEQLFEWINITLPK